MADAEELRRPALEAVKASKTPESPKVLGVPVMTKVSRQATRLSSMPDGRTGVLEARASVHDHVCTLEPASSLTEQSWQARAAMGARNYAH